jgi:rubrerythrin
MEFKSIEEAIRFAIQKEEASTQFYHDIAERMENPATKIIFEVLSRTESQHKANLELELMKIGKTVMQQPCDIPELLPDSAYIEVDEDAAQMSFVDALQVAIGKEKAAFILYVGMMAQTTDPEMRRILLDLSEEEMRHMIQFENEYNNIVSNKK